MPHYRIDMEADLASILPQLTIEVSARMNEDDDHSWGVFQGDEIFGVVPYDSRPSLPFTGMRRPHPCERVPARSRESLVSGINALKRVTRRLMIASVPAENLPPKHRTRRHKWDDPNEHFDVVHRRRPGC